MSSKSLIICNDKEVVVDTVHYDMLSKYVWYLAQYNQEFLPCTTIETFDMQDNVVYSHIWMHELICKKYNVQYSGLLNRDRSNVDLCKTNIWIKLPVKPSGNYHFVF
jgi:hypothetical protein